MAISKRSFALALGTILLLAGSLPSLAGSRGESMLQQSFDAGPGGLLTIDVHDADIELMEHRGDGVLVAVYLDARNMEWATERFEKMNVRAEGNDGGVAVRSDRVSGSWTDWRRGGFSVTIVVKLPREFNVDARTEDGDITLRRLQGNAKLVSSDGDIWVNSIDGAAIELRTSDGDVEAEHLIADRIEVHSSDGDIRLDHVEGALEAVTSDGDIHVVFERIERTSLRTSDGDIMIKAPGSTGIDVKLRGEDVVLRGATDFDGSRRDGRAEGRLNGGGASLTASTGDGDVVLRLE